MLITFDSLIGALKYPILCKNLNLRFVKIDIQSTGQSFSKFHYLKGLYIQGDPSIYDLKDFTLPEEIGQLKRIEKLSLLNVPIATFPEWIWGLKRLKYLMLRGTDIDSIPDRIHELKELTTLRFENCPLTTLPLEISKLKKLKNLGLSDTKLTNIDPESLPKSLKKINLAGTTLYNLDIKLNVKQLNGNGVK